MGRTVEKFIRYAKMFISGRIQPFITPNYFLRTAVTPVEFLEQIHSLTSNKRQSNKYKPYWKRVQEQEEKEQQERETKELRAAMKKPTDAQRAIIDEQKLTRLQEAYSIGTSIDCLV